MDTSGKIKIRIRSRGAAGRIEVREKYSYSCGLCRNQYYDHHPFCPQCLGEVEPIHEKPSSLRILSIPEARVPETAQLLAILTGKTDFDFHKVLESPPWLMMERSEECVLRHWKEVLEAEKAKVEMAPWQPQPKKRWRGRAPLYASKAPLPFFVSEATTDGVRRVARALKDPAVRIKWSETVLAGIRIAEGFYKRHSAHRVLFSDFLFQIDHELQEAVKDYDALYSSARESEMNLKIQAILDRFQEMAREIEEVRRRVEERL